MRQGARDADGLCPETSPRLSSVEEERMMSEDQRTAGDTARDGSTDDAGAASGGSTGGTDATTGGRVTGSEVAAKEGLGGGTSDGDTPSTDDAG